ncbi:MAG: hypothetical protein NCW75_05035 [Phycisphaera sp.]|nr:MAG: hypothetical protein NCW75_05035 [Phycisphaera sp.]
MLDDDRMFKELATTESGPMPGSVGDAVARRRMVVRVRRGGAIAGCIALFGLIVALWGPPASAPHTQPGPVVDNSANSEPATGVRFASGSVLALRMSGLDEAWPAVPASPRRVHRDDSTMYRLRERELTGLSLPAS